MVDSRGTRGVVGPFGGGHVEVGLVIFRSGRIFTDKIAVKYEFGHNWSDATTQDFAYQNVPPSLLFAFLESLSLSVSKETALTPTRGVRSWIRTRALRVMFGANFN
jgi:hypothetical protein